MSSPVQSAYSLAQERYAALGVDTEAALRALAGIPISLHCWQGDDVGGFENTGSALGGGLAVTGNYPGKARTPDELRADLDKALSLIPGKHRLNLHASYAETGGRHGRARRARARALRALDRLGAGEGLGMDFNPTFFAHPKAADGFTLVPPRRGHPPSSGSSTASPAARSARPSAQALGSPCVTNVWIPDGSKDTPVDRKGPRERLTRVARRDLRRAARPARNLRRGRGKLFGIGSESYVVGSHEFYLGYAIPRRKLLCLDAGHFHPTEVISDKISAVLCLARRDPAARQPRRALGQRPRRHADRRAAGDRPGGGPRRLPRAASTSASTSSTPASTASPPG